MPSFQSRLDLREQSARQRLQHSTWAKPNRYAAAGISPRRELAFMAVALVLLAVGVLVAGCLG